MGVMAWLMPLFVACSTFGCINGVIFASARIFFVGARKQVVQPMNTTPNYREPLKGIGQVS